MSKFYCRLCTTQIDISPLLSMSPFPKAAQYYPEKNEFEKDTGITLDVYRCPSCDLLQLDCEPVSYYKEVITAASFSKDARKARLKELSYFVELFGLKGKRVIEVGSGKGGMVDIMNEAGMAAEGLEYSKESIEFSQNSKIQMIQGYIDELDSKYDNKFDAFISLNYIEHQPDTKSFIRSLSRITKSGANGKFLLGILQKLLNNFFRSSTLFLKAKSITIKASFLFIFSLLTTITAVISLFLLSPKV